MNLATAKAFVIRHKVSIRDLSLLAAFLAVIAYIAFTVDIFVTQGDRTVRQQGIELDEALLLGTLLALGLLIFAWRRYAEQGRETRARIAAERHARELAYRDGLTGLPNRRQFDEVLRAALAAPPRAGASHGLFLLDLNGFKQVNDRHGHGTGDQLLIVVAERLLSAMRDGTLVARFGGDEFAIIAHHLPAPEAAAGIALRVIEALATPISIAGTPHHVGVGIGIALLPGDAGNESEALRKADVALYRAKAEQRSAFRFFEEEMDRRVQEREHLERALRAAMEAGAVEVVFEPTYDLRTGEVVAFEAMPRWIDPHEGEIAPQRFLSIAEEAGLVHQLAEDLLRRACAAAVTWPEHIHLSIDIVPVQLKDPLLAARVVSILAEAGLPAERLEVAITESALVADLEQAQLILGALRAAGVKIALDNFGTGYSSLYHLRNFKLDKIKIDRSFVDAMTSEAESAAIVQALVGLAHGLGLTVAAEGVDDTARARELIGTGCEQAQGSLLGAPLTAAQTRELVPGRYAPGSARA